MPRRRDGSIVVVSIMNFYNDNDPRICAWLEELQSSNLIPKGKVDGRDIRKLKSKDLRGFTQHHFFCGIGGWPAALELAGWPTDRPVWSASLPCQPWSAAGKQKGTKDERDLCPAFLELVRELRPETIFGEQVASNLTVGCIGDTDGESEEEGSPILRGFEKLIGTIDGETDEKTSVWLDRVSDELEKEGYTIGAVVLPACSVGAPHRRYRIFWVANRQDIKHERSRDSRQWREGFANCGDVSLSDAECSERRALNGSCGDEGRNGLPQREEGPGRIGVDSEDGKLENSDSRRWNARRPEPRPSEAGSQPGFSGQNISVGQSDSSGSQPGQQAAQRNGHWHSAEPASGELAKSSQSGLEMEGHSKHEQGQNGIWQASLTGDASRRGYWSNFELCHFTDGKIRRIEPGTFPVAPRLPKGMVPGSNPSLSEVQNTFEARSWRLHGYGNSIVIQLAAEFLKSCMEIFDERNAERA